MYCNAELGFPQEPGSPGMRGADVGVPGAVGNWQPGEACPARRRGSACSRGAARLPRARLCPRVPLSQKTPGDTWEPRSCDSCPQWLVEPPSVEVIVPHKLQSRHEKLADLGCTVTTAHRAVRAPRATAPGKPKGECVSGPRGAHPGACRLPARHRSTCLSALPGRKCYCLGAHCLVALCAGLGVRAIRAGLLRAMGRPACPSVRVTGCGFPAPCFLPSEARGTWDLRGLQFGLRVAVPGGDSVSAASLCFFVF